MVIHHNCERVGDCSYIVRIGNRDVKRHIDDLIRDNSGKESYIWMYENDNAEGSLQFQL